MGFYGDVYTEIVTVTDLKDICFGKNYKDQILHTKLWIPSSWYSHGKLDVGFKIVMNAIKKESAAIDNVRLTGYCSAPRNLRENPLPTNGNLHGQVLQLQSTPQIPAEEPDTDGGDDSYYCLAADFPCEGEGMVHVCHYSARKGYQTFCIPEPDSDILRFYHNDYCGPCVGGYGGINMN